MSNDLGIRDTVRFRMRTKDTRGRRGSEELRDYFAEYARGEARAKGLTVGLITQFQVERVEAERELLMSARVSLIPAPSPEIVELVPREMLVRAYLALMDGMKDGTGLVSRSAITTAARESAMKRWPDYPKVEAVAEKQLTRLPQLRRLLEVSPEPLDMVYAIGGAAMVREATLKKAAEQWSQQALAREANNALVGRLYGGGPNAGLGYMDAVNNPQQYYEQMQRQLASPKTATEIRMEQALKVRRAEEMQALMAQVDVSKVWGKAYINDMIGAGTGFMKYADMAGAGTITQQYIPVSDVIKEPPKPPEPKPDGPRGLDLDDAREVALPAQAARKLDLE